MLFWLSYECFPILCDMFLLKSVISSHNDCDISILFGTMTLPSQTPYVIMRCYNLDYIQVPLKVVLPLVKVFLMSHLPTWCSTRSSYKQFLQFLLYIISLFVCLLDHTHKTRSKLFEDISPDISAVQSKNFLEMHQLICNLMT